MVRWVHSQKHRFDKVIVVGNWGGWEGYWKSKSTELGSADNVGVGDVEGVDEKWAGEVVWLREGDGAASSYEMDWLCHTTAFFGQSPESWTDDEWEATQVVNAVCQSAELLGKGWTDVDVWRELSIGKGEVRAE